MKIIHSKDIPVELNSEYDSILRSDVSDSSIILNKIASPEETKQLNFAIHGERHLKAISIKMPDELLDELKNLARRDHIGYQTYIKFILSQHVRNLKQQELSKNSSSNT